MSNFTNTTFDEVSIDATETVSRRLSQTEIEALALVSGDVDPFHIDGAHNRTAELRASAVGAEALISALLARRLPGPGTIILSQQLNFAGDVGSGDLLTASVTAREKRSADTANLFYRLATEPCEFFVIFR